MKLLLIALASLMLIGCAGGPAPITKPNYTGRDFSQPPVISAWNCVGKPCDEGLGADGGGTGYQ